MGKNLKEALEKVEPYIRDGEFPRDIIAICKKFGIKVQETPDFPDDVSGLIYKDKENENAANADKRQYYILVNSKHAAARKAFTIAHELGHYLMHKDILEQDEIVSGTKGFDAGAPAYLARKKIEQDSSADYRKRETEANTFAAEILMPREQFLDKCLKAGSTINEVADYFGVSISAATIRADRLIGLYFL